MAGVRREKATADIAPRLDMAELSKRLSEAPDSSALRPVGIRAAAIGPNALDELPSLAASLLPSHASGIALLTDAVPKQREGSELLPLIEQYLARLGDVHRIELQGEGGRVHADAATLAHATREVAGAGGLVTVGSGTLADIGKAVAAALDGLPHIVVQTATSVNGFADDQSVLLINGVKRTTPTRWPDALVADAEVLVSAPTALNLAGVGDLAAMFTAPADWRLASYLGMADSYSTTAVELVRSHGTRVLGAASALAQGDRRAAVTVAYVLTLSGVAMGAAGTTAPASGMEHTVSHLIEMAMNRRGRDAPYHGAQVGVSTIIAALLWKRMYAHLRTRPAHDLLFPSQEEMETRVRDAFSPLDSSGEMGEECWRLYSKKLRRWVGNRPRLERVDWREVGSAVKDLLVDPRELIASLVTAGAPARFAQLDPPIPADLARWALANCHLMRGRFTVADLAFFLGMWDADHVESVLTEAAGMGAGL